MNIIKILLGRNEDKIIKSINISLKRGKDEKE
jgi:hypothetical protein